MLSLRIPAHPGAMTVPKSVFSGFPNMKTFIWTSPAQDFTVGTCSGMESMSVVRKKIVFGSDMPVCSVGMYVYGALMENLTKEELRLVMGANFRRLLGNLPE